MSRDLYLPQDIGISLLWQQSFLFQVRNENTRTPRDLSDWELTLRIRNAAGRIVATVTEVASATGNLLSGGADGTLVATLRMEATAKLLAGRHSFELDGARSDGQVERFIDGYVRVRAPAGLVAQAQTTLVTRTTSALIVDDGRDVSVVRVERGIPGRAGNQGPAGADGATGPAGPAAVKAYTDNALSMTGSERLKFGASLKLTQDAAGDVNVTANDRAVATEYPFNARSSTVTATIATVTSGNAAIVLPSNATLADGGTEWRERDGVFLPGCGPAHSMVTPAAPICTLKTWTGNPVTTGSVQLDYQIVAICEDLGMTLPSATATVSNAPAYFGADLGARSSSRYSRADFLVTTPLTLGNNTRFHDGRAHSDQGTTTNRWLLLAQAAPAENGVYSATIVNDATVSITTRAGDLDTAAELFLGRRIIVQLGDSGACRFYRINVAPTTVNVDPVELVEETFVEVTPYIVDADYYATGSLNLAAVSETSADVDRADGGSGSNRTIAAGEILFLSSQANQAENGVYTFGVPVAGSAALTRISGYNQTAEMLLGTVIRVRHGTTSHRRKNWVQTSAAPAAVGTDAVTYAAETALWYAVYRRRGGAGSYTFVGAFGAEPYWISSNTQSTIAFRDYGEGAMSGHTTIPSTVPSTQRNKGLRTRLASVSGTSATLRDAPSASGSSVVMYHDNKEAFDDMHALSVDASAGTNDGVAQYWPSGTYNFIGARLGFYKAIELRGFGRSTKFNMLAGSNLRGFHTNTIDSPSFANTSQFSRIENITLQSEYGLPAGAKYVDPEDYAHGCLLHLNARAMVVNCRSTSGVGTGIAWDGRDNMGANVNNWFMQFCTITSMRGHGVVWSGSDGNAGHSILNSATNNYGHGFYDSAFLNNKHDTPHTEGNLLRASYWGGLNTLVDCEYSEGAQCETYISDGSMVHGGTHGTPINRSQGLVISQRTDVDPFEVNGGPRDSVARAKIKIGGRSVTEMMRYHNEFADSTPGLTPWSWLVTRDSVTGVQLRDPSSLSVIYATNKRRVTANGQSAAIAAANLYSSNPPSGLYRVALRLQCTTADATAGTIRVNIGWDGRSAAEVANGTVLDLATPVGNGRGVQDFFAFYSDGAHNITYEVELVSGAINSARYAIELMVELVSR